MGIASGTLSYRRYFVEGELKGGENYILERLKLYRPPQLSPDSTEEYSAGWTSIEAILGDQLLPGQIFHARWAIFALRIDSWKLSPTLIKAYLQREEQKTLQKTEREKLTPKERKKLREKVKRELKQKTLPQLAIYDICWDWRNQTLRFWSQSQRINEIFVELFEKSFPELSLVPQTPYTLSEKLFTERELKQLLETEPSDFFRREDLERWTA